MSFEYQLAALCFLAWIALLIAFGMLGDRKPY